MRIQEKFDQGQKRLLNLLVSLPSRYYTVIVFLVFFFGFVALVIFTSASTSHISYQNIVDKGSSQFPKQNNDNEIQELQAQGQAPFLAMQFAFSRDGNFGKPRPSCLKVLVGEYSASMGLGNLMFVFATTYGLSRSHSISMGYLSDSDWSGLGVFTNIQISPHALSATDYVKFDSGGSCCMYNRMILPDISNLECNQIGLVTGYLQSWVYFHSYRDDLLTIFTFPKHLKAYVNSKIATILQEMSLLDIYNDQKSGEGRHRKRVILVGVHVRRNDFTYESNRQNGYVPTSPRYLRRAIDTISRIHGSKRRQLVFFIVCDDILWCFENLQSTLRGRNLVHVMNMNREDCMYLLSISNIVILTAGGSTFGWWGAYLSNATVYYNKLFAIHNSWLSEQFVETEYFPPGWIPLSLKNNKTLKYKNKLELNFLTNNSRSNKYHNQ